MRRSRFAAGHLLISLLIAAASSTVVFGLWYPAPWRQMLQVRYIFFLILAVDVACGPLLTLILANPKKSRRDRWLDFSFIGIIQLAALAYGMHSVWAARPVILGFEVDRLVIVTANEVQMDELQNAPANIQRLPWSGPRRVGTRLAADEAEFFQSVELGLAGISPSMRPGWWRPWSEAYETMVQRAKPLAELIANRPQDADILFEAARSSGLGIDELQYLPLVSSRTLDWVALLDRDMKIVGHAPVDGF